MFLCGHIESGHWSVLPERGIADGLREHGAAYHRAGPVRLRGLHLDSWKRQMLLNLLKVRYTDAPVFLDISSVINSYSLEGASASAAN